MMNATFAKQILHSGKHLELAVLSGAKTISHIQIAAAPYQSYGESKWSKLNE